MIKKIILAMLFSLCCHAQKVKWEQTLGGSHSEYLFDMIPTADYGFLLAGSSLSGKEGDLKSAKRGNIDAWLWKMKEDGSQEWQYRLGGDGNDYLHSVCHTYDGGFLLGITSTSGKSGDKTQANKGKEDLWIVKLNAAKQIEWQTAIGGTGSDEVVKVLALKGGEYTVLANSNSPVSGDKTDKNYGGKDIWILKLNRSGAVVWQKTYGGEYNDRGVDLIETQDRGLLIGAVSNSDMNGNKAVKTYGESDYWLIKLDQTGKEQWQRVYGGSAEEQLKQIQQTEEGGYLLFGTSNSDLSGSKDKNLESLSDFWLIQTDEEGMQIDEFVYSYGERNLLSNGLITPKGELFVGGSTLTKTLQKESFSYIGVLLTKEKEVDWEYSVSSKGTDILTKVVQTRDGGYVFAGTSDGTKSKAKQAHKGGNDFWIVKLKNDLDRDKEERASIEVFPNPTSGYTNVVMGFDYQKGHLQMFDMSGRLMLSKDIEYQTEPVDLSVLPKGVYIIWVKTDTRDGSVKVMKK